MLAPSFMLLIMSANSPLPEPPISIPIEAFEPMGEYMGCLFDKPLPRLLASSIAEREQLVDSILAQCLEIRSNAIRLANESISSAEDTVSTENLKSNIEAIASRWETTLRVMIVDQEKFIEQSEVYEKCLDEKGMENC